MSEAKDLKTFLNKLLQMQIQICLSECGDIEVGMFYYNEDKTFSKTLIENKQVSGVVAFVDIARKHGLVVLLREANLQWSNYKFPVGMYEVLSGKENTQLILTEAKILGIKADAAEYCANYAYDGIKTGEAFFPSKEELDEVYKNKDAINFSLGMIKGAQLLKNDFYGTSSEYDSSYAWCQNFGDGKVFCNYKMDNNICVRPMMSF